jgi:hypothetical protein
VGGHLWPNTTPGGSVFNFLWKVDTNMKKHNPWFRMVVVLVGRECERYF